MIYTMQPVGADADLAFAVLLAIAPGEDWSLGDLAELSGLSLEGVRMIERRALRKVLRALQREGVCRAHAVSLGGYRSERRHRSAGEGGDSHRAKQTAPRPQDGAPGHAAGGVLGVPKESFNQNSRAGANKGRFRSMTL